MMKNLHQSAPISLVFAVLALLGLGSAAHAQAPANDDPCGAVVLTPQGGLCLTPTASTNVGATTTVPNGYGNSGSPKDVWFRFTTAASGPASFGATLTVTGNPAGIVQLFSVPAGSGCAGPFTTLAFSPLPGLGMPNTGAPRLITGLLSPSTDYFVRVAGFTDTDQTGAFTICLTDGPGAPTCTTPTVQAPVLIGPANTSATVAFTPGINNLGPYTVTVQSTGLPTQTYSVVASPATITGLLPGVSYTVQVSAQCPAASGPPTPVVSLQVSFAVPLPNDEPCGAIALPLGQGSQCTPLSQNSSGATYTPTNGYTSGGCVGGTQPADLWYTINTGSSTTITLTVDGRAAQMLRLFSAASCAGPFTQLGCSRNLTSVDGAVPLTVSGLTPNTTYYAHVSQGNGSTGAFTICASTGAVPVPCPSTTGIIVLSISSTTATAIVQPPQSGVVPVNYTFIITPAGGPPVTSTITNTFVPLTGLVPGTTYTLTVVSNCLGGGQGTPSTATFTTTGTSPSCPAVTGLSAAATGPASAAAAFSAVSGALSYTATFVTAGQPTLTATSTTSPVSISGLLSGTTYQVCVTTNCPGSQSSAPVCTSLTMPGTLPCFPPANVSVVPSATAPLTGLTVTFTTATPAATGTTATIRPAAGGPLVTVTGVTSPYNFTGLTPNTSYEVCLTTTCTGGLTSSPICVLVSTASTPPTCVAPANVSVVPSATAPLTGLTVTFTAATPSTTATITPTAGGPPFTATGVTSPYTFTGLTPNTTYQVCLTSDCGGGVISAPACATVSTAIPCGAPANLSVIRSTNAPLTGLTATFTAASPGVTSTTATITPTAGGPTVRVIGVTSPYTFTGLTPNTSYQVCLTNNCAGGSTSVPTCATASTALPCAAATNLSLTRVGTTGNTYSFAWTGPANGLGYAVSYTAQGSSPQSAPTSVSPITLTLLPGVAYTFSVGVDCGFNNAAPIATATFTTALASRQAELAALVDLFPNPAHHSAMLAVPAALLLQPATLAVYNAQGQVVRTATVPAARTAAQVALNLVSLPAGLYLVQLVTSQGALVKPLVVE